MKNNIFIKSTFILLIGGIITKFLGMIIKIVMSRLLSTEGIGLYMLIIPTLSLILTLSNLGFPIAISKFTAEDTRNNKNLVFSLIPISILINIIIMIVLILSSKYISTYLLKESRVYLPILCISFIIPFTSISSIIRSYFFGKQKMFPHVISNIIEDIIRLIIYIIGIPLFLKYGLVQTLCFLIISNIICEISSIIVLLFFLPKNIEIKRSDLKPNKRYIKESLSIGIPNTMGKLVGSIGYFLEPILLTFGLLLNGYSNSYIIYEYGVVSGYVIPLLLLPSFFSMAISQALLPEVSKYSVRMDYSSIKRKLRQSVILCFLIGFVFTFVIFIYPSFFLNLLYKTSEGITYIRYLAPICILQYIQSPLASTLDALGESRIIMISTFIGTVVRCIVLFLFAFLHIGIYTLILSIGFNIIVVSIYQYLKLKKILKKKDLNNN